jgi:hypothetical protein
MNESNVQEAEVVEKLVAKSIDRVKVTENRDSFKKQIADIDTSLRNLTEHRLKLMGAIDASELLLKEMDK